MSEPNLTIQLPNYNQLLLEQTTRPEIPSSLLTAAKEVSSRTGLSVKKILTDGILRELKRIAKTSNIEVKN